MTKKKRERQVPVFGLTDPSRTNTKGRFSLDERGSREFGGPATEITEGWVSALRYLPDHDVIRRQVTRYTVMFHHGPPASVPGHSRGGLATSGSTVERAKELGDMHPEYAPAYVIDLLTGKTYPVWGDKAAQGPQVPRPDRSKKASKA